MFRQLKILILAQGHQWPTAQTLEEALAAHAFVPLGAAQELSVGWSPPRRQEHGALVEVIGGHYVLRLEMESKSVPSQTVRAKVDERIAEIEQATGRKPGKKERRDLADEALRALLPSAFAKRDAVFVWIDPTSRLLVIGSTSQRKVDHVVGELIRALDGLHLGLVQTVQSPQAAMTQWLLAPNESEWPADLTVERECVLKSMGDDAATVRFSRHHLMNDDVRKHVTEGKLPTQIALSWDGRVSFVLTDALSFNKVCFLDGVMKDFGSDQAEDRFDADVALNTGVLGPCIAGVLAALGGLLNA